MYFVYSALLASVFLLSSPWWILQAAVRRKYREGLGERLGNVPARLRPSNSNDARPVVWIHAVSVGEVLAIAGIAEQLQQLGFRVAVSTTTMTGQKLARERFGAGNACYFPLDFAFCIRPYLQALRPQLVILAETEFWPNFLRLAKNSGARLAVVNARISDRSFPRYRRWRGLLHRVLQHVDLFCAQSEQDSRRLRDIGAPAERVEVAGNLKFDTAPPSELPIVQQMRAAIRQGGATPVIVCGSTVEGEEPWLLQDFAAQLVPRYPRALMVMAPRHPERFGQVAQTAASYGLGLERRSQWTGAGLTGGIFLLDSIGELAGIYSLADVAIVGGGFAMRGGHNILEPAFFAKPIVIGPHTENFRDIVEQFRAAGAIEIIEARKAISIVLELLNDKECAALMGTRARQTLTENAGATARTLSRLNALLASQDRALAKPEGSR